MIKGKPFVKWAGGNVDTITTSKNNEKLIKDSNAKSIGTYYLGEV